jgi:hypothetical protein
VCMDALISRQNRRGELVRAMHALTQRTPKPWMAEAGLLARQDAELRAILDNAGGVSPKG